MIPLMVPRLLPPQVTAPSRKGSQSFSPQQAFGRVELPAVNIRENGSEYIIILAVPGMKRNEFCVEIKELALTISASHSTTENKQALRRCEFDLSEWKREITLPEDADPLLTTANYENGELRIHIPRSTPTVREKDKIKVYVY